MKNILFSLILLCIAAAVQAQGDNSYKIPMIAQVNGDAVQLRWAPGSPMTWEQMRSAGIYIDRHTLMRDGKMLPLEQRQAYVRLTQEPLRPAAEEVFGSGAESDRYIAIGGQALYGASFEVTSNQGSNTDMGALINTSKDNQNRFNYSLFAADQSWEALVMRAQR